MVGTQRSGILVLRQTGCWPSGKVCPSLGLSIPICTLAWARPLCTKSFIYCATSSLYEDAQVEQIKIWNAQ